MTKPSIYTSGPFSYTECFRSVRLLRPLFALLLVIAYSLQAVPPVGAEERPVYRVLLLNSYHQGFKWTDEITSSVTSTLTTSLKRVDLHIEYMDTKRFNNDRLFGAFRRFLSLKYGTQRPDIIITSDDDALNFMKRYHHELFPDAPVVFCGVNNVASALSAPKQHFTGLIEVLDIRDNIALAKKLFPQTGEIVVVTDGTPTGLGTRRMASEAEPGYPDMTFTYLNGENLTTGEMLARLGGLRKGSIVIAPAWYKDRNGKTFDNTSIYPLIAGASPVPVIANSSANLGLGLIGGKVNSGEIQGQYAAEQAVRILSGQATPLTIPVETSSLNRYMFDSRQLARFGIDESALPAGSIVIHRPFSFYETYRYLVWGVVAVFALFAAMIIALLVNINRLRDARGRLARSEEDLRITLHSIGDAVITTDTNGFITRMNPVAESLTEWLFQDAHGKPLHEVLHLINAVDRKKRPDPVTSVLASAATSFENATILVARSGAEYRIADSGAAIRNKDGKEVGVVLVFRDITSEYLMDVKRNQIRKLEALGQLAGGVAHDFNNMLTGIIGSSEILTLQLDTESPLRKYVNIILRASENAAALTRKLLVFSRKETIEVKPMNVHESINNALSLLGHTLNKNISIIRKFNAVAPMVEGDSSQIENSIINLGVNAGYSMPGGGQLAISTENVVLDDAYCQASPFDLTPGPYLKVDIKDTGSGIPSEMLHRIFEPFFTTKEVGKGTGLGLSAVYGIITEHRGCISVYSEVGTGTEFNLYLPVTDSPFSAMPQQEAHPIPGSGRILIIDDEETIRMSASSMLKHLGYQMLLAHDGQEGLQMYKTHFQSIDLVLLDMIMPRMGGLACFRELRMVNPRVKVLVSSGFAQEDELAELQNAGIMGYIQKPYYTTTLSWAVARALGS
jgi:two-component system, cell cycle sensor histidine kinase and response regulator CckA